MNSNNAARASACVDSVVRSSSSHSRVAKLSAIHYRSNRRPNPSTARRPVPGSERRRPARCTGNLDRSDGTATGRRWSTAISSARPPARAKMPRHGPTDDAPAEHVEDDGQVQEAGQGRDVGDVGDPEPVRRVRLKRRATRCRGRAGLGIPACRARAAAPAHPGDADGPHDPGDPLAAHRDTALGQLGVNPRSTIRPSTAAVNRLDASPELGTARARADGGRRRHA